MDSPGWRKLYLKMAAEMHEEFPHLTQLHCYEMIKARHIENFEKNKKLAAEHYQKEMSKEKNK